MPICPACKSEQKRRNNEGRCPGCGVRISAYSGYWYEESLGSPTLSIVKWFEQHVSDVLSYGRETEVVFSIPRKGARWKRELVAAQRLLNATEGDYTLVIEALTLLFTDKKFNWKVRDTLIFIERPFLTALSVAKSNRIAEEQNQAANRSTIDRLSNRENLFA